MKDAARGPCLWDVGPQVLHRECLLRARLTRTARIELRQAVAREAARRLRDITGDAGGLGEVAVASKPQRDDPVVVRPDRSPLIGKGVVGGILRGERADTPPTPHIG